MVMVAKACISDYLDGFLTMICPAGEGLPRPPSQCKPRLGAKHR